MTRNTRLTSLFVIASAVVLIGALLAMLLGDAGHRLMDWNKNRTKNLPISHKATCENNLRQIGTAFKLWSLDNHGQFPFNVSTNEGGTMEEGAFDSTVHFQPLSNELASTKVLVCPDDKLKKAANDFQNLRAENVSYILRVGTNLNAAMSNEILVICPIHSNVLYCDGTLKVTGGTTSKGTDNSMHVPFN